MDMTEKNRTRLYQRQFNNVEHRSNGTSANAKIILRFRKKKEGLISYSFIGVYFNDENFNNDDIILESFFFKDSYNFFLIIFYVVTIFTNYTRKCGRNSHITS